MIVIDVPGESVEKRSLREEQQQLTQKLVTFVSADRRELTHFLDVFCMQMTTDYPGFKTEIEAGIETIKSGIRSKVSYLKTGEVDTPRHVKLVEYLANKYDIDEKIR